MKSITFTGGLGAQINSAAAYFFLKLQGVPVRANFEYFELAAKADYLQRQGIKINTGVSFFNWQLDDLGVFQSSFNLIGPESELIFDGTKKHQLALSGFRNFSIRSLFSIPQRSFEIKQELFGKDRFTCIHIRRGDYLNVASYLVSYEDFLSAIQSVSKLTSYLLVLSDSPLTEDFSQKVSSFGLNVKCVIGGNPGIVHGLMRLSDILICSNSQYSFTVACLRNSDQLTIIPSKHDSGEDPSANAYLNEIRAFQVMTSF